MCDWTGRSTRRRVTRIAGILAVVLGVCFIYYSGTRPCIQGTVVGPDGTPAPGVRLIVLPHFYHSAVSDEQGRFQIDGVCRAPIVITALSPGRQPDMTAMVEVMGGATDVKIVMLPSGERGRQRASQQSRGLGKPLPELPDLGSEAAADDLTDKPLLICLFDLGQRPSRHCVQELVKQADVLAGKGVKIVAIQALPTEGSGLDTWIKQENVPFPVARLNPDDEKMASSWRSESLPWLILTDHNHVVTAEGFAPGELQAKMDTVLKN